MFSACCKNVAPLAQVLVCPALGTLGTNPERPLLWGAPAHAWRESALPSFGPITFYEVRVCNEKLPYISCPERASLARHFIASYGEALPSEVMDALPHSIIHSDINDTNLLFEGGRIAGVLDFGDSIRSCTVFDVGIAAAYYSLAQEDPLRVFGEVLRGYLRSASLTEPELAAFFHVAYGRVLLSACFSAQSCAAEPDNEYLAHTGDDGPTRHTAASKQCVVFIPFCPALLLAMK